MGESRQTSGKWSQTYILSISGSFNAVLEQTNSKLPENNWPQPRIFLRIFASSLRTSVENTRIFGDCQASAGVGIGGSRSL